MKYSRNFSLLNVGFLIILLFVRKTLHFMIMADRNKERYTWGRENWLERHWWSLWCVLSEVYCFRRKILIEVWFMVFKSSKDVKIEVKNLFKCFGTRHNLKLGMCLHKYALLSTVKWLLTFLLTFWKLTRILRNLPKMLRLCFQKSPKWTRYHSHKTQQTIFIIQNSLNPHFESKSFRIYAQFSLQHLRNSFFQFHLWINMYEIHSATRKREGRQTRKLNWLRHTKRP